MFFKMTSTQNAYVLFSGLPLLHFWGDIDIYLEVIMNTRCAEQMDAELAGGVRHRGVAACWRQSLFERGEKLLDATDLQSEEASDQSP